MDRAEGAVGFLKETVMRTTMLAVVLTMGAMAAGCGAADQATDDVEESAADLAKADVIYPKGAYANDQAAMGDFFNVTLRADRSFFRKEFVECIRAEGCGELVGTYKFTRSSTKRYVRFYDESGAFIDRYAWKLSGNTLTLTDSTGHAQTLRHLAGEGESCGGFIASANKCEPGLVCKYSGVPDLPGKCVKQQNACEAAGGSCVALVPGNCDNGAVGDATQYSCGGALGVECCLPKAPASDCRTNGCSTGQDCSYCWGHFACIPHGALC